MNAVDRLLAKPFVGLELEEQMEIKRLGPDHPEINLEQAAEDVGEECACKFSRSWYDNTPWLTASASRNSLFCFPCLLFGDDVAWTKVGVTDLKCLSEEVNKHEECKSHMNSSLKFALFGKMTVAQRLDESYSLSVARHNEEVDKNRYTLSKLIDCLRLCGNFELPLCYPDETEFVSSGVFTGLIDFVGSLDSAMKAQFDRATVFKGTSEAVQNDLLDCMLDVTRQYIIEELRSTAYLAIIANGTTDVSTCTQSALIYRYIDGDNKVVERFFCFVSSNCSTDTISTALLKQLKLVFPEAQDREKVIAQSYDGHRVMCGVQKKVKELCPNAHYIQCYAHQMNLIMRQAASKISHARHFLCDMYRFSDFFSSSKKMELLENIVMQRFPRISSTSWSLNVQTVQVIYEHREALHRGFEAMENEVFHSDTLREARGCTRALGDREFLFFLFFFNDVMFHVDILDNRLQKQDIDAVCIQKATLKFVDSINRVRLSIETLDSKLPIESKFNNPKMNVQTLNQAAREVCDIIVVHVKDYFAFTKHLASATLLQNNLFASHAKSFPTDALNDTLQAYPILNKKRLKNELSLLYETPEFHCANGAIPLLRLFIGKGLQNTFSETVRLLRIVITTPMTTSEADRTFFTLEKIKKFLRGTMAQDRLDALAMLSVEKELVRIIPEFNKQTIERFASIKEWGSKFGYK